MGVLNDLASNKVTQETTMPNWYDQAQQNVVNKAAAGAGAVPALANTVAGGAINQLSGASNPFTQAQGTLNQIATGAANPWITGANGQVTPNTNTALGGLFQAQNQQLNQLLPNITAPVEGANIASGNFGSLRGQTAVNKAKADALSALNTQQFQAALNNQQTGVQAATGLGNVGSQGVTSMVNVGQAQQADPLLAASGLGKIVAGIQSPTTVTSQTQLSPLNLAGTLLAATNGSIAGVSKLLDSMNISGGLSALTKGIGSIFGIGGEDKVYPLDGGGQVILKPDGSKIVTNGQGQTSVFDKNGNPIGNTFPGTSTAGSGGSTSTGGTKPSTGGLPSTGGTGGGGGGTGGGGTGGGGLGGGSGITTDANGNPTPGIYRLADGSAMTIGSDGSLTIAKADGSQQVFDSEGNQLSHTDANGNNIQETGGGSGDGGGYGGDGGGSGDGGGGGDGGGVIVAENNGGGDGGGYGGDGGGYGGDGGGIIVAENNGGGGFEEEGYA
jgi:hypothetical protein